MTEHTHAFTYRLYASPAELHADDRALLERAVAACQDSYSPYSDFKVGAALRLANGKVFAGSNFENASYPLCLCAERIALGAAHAVHPDVPVLEMAVTAISPSAPIDRPVPPCGACRQVLAEVERRHDQPIRLWLRGQTGPVAMLEATQLLLPFGFDGTFL